MGRRAGPLQALYKARQQEPYELRKSTEYNTSRSGHSDSGREGRTCGTCKHARDVVSSREGSGGRHLAESAPLESPGGGELGGGESDGEGGGVEGDVGDDDARVGGRAGGLWLAEQARLRGGTRLRGAKNPGPARLANTNTEVDFTTTSLQRVGRRRRG